MRSSLVAIQMLSLVYRDSILGLHIPVVGERDGLGAPIRRITMCQSCLATRGGQAYSPVGRMYRVELGRLHWKRRKGQFHGFALPRKEM